MRTKIWITDYETARKFTPKTPTIAVRIFDPDAILPRHNCEQPLVPSYFWIGEVKSWFEDYDPLSYEKNGVHDIAQKLKNNPRTLTPTIAEKLLRDFQQCLILKDKGINPALLIHCNAGISRSPATARALTEIFKLDPIWMESDDELNVDVSKMRDGYIGNLWVYQTLKDSARRLGLSY